MLYVMLRELELRDEDSGFGRMKMLVERYLHAISHTGCISFLHIQQQISSTHRK